MKSNMLLNIYLALISLIGCDIPTFEITEVYHQGTRCDDEEGFFYFVINGKGKGIEGEIRINLPLKSPENCSAACTVNSEEMICTMDAYIYDLEGEKILEVKPDEPIFDNLKITNWVEYFIPERRILNHATNCKRVERPVPDPEIFAAFEAKNLEILGCFGNKNNSSFKLTKEKEDTSIMKDSLDQDIYFEIVFEKPSKDKALCVIPKNFKDVYTVRCAIEFGGEITVGHEAVGTFNMEDKNLKILIRGLLIPPTIVDECTDAKNNNDLLF